MAATIAAQSGANVLLSERESRIGGRLGLQVQPLQGPWSIFRGRNGETFCQQLVEGLTSAGGKVNVNTAVSAVWAEGSRGTCVTPVEGQTFRLALTIPTETEPGHEVSTEVQAAVVVLATGSWEPWSEFPGSKLPGVMLSGDAQEMVNVEGATPGRRALIVGSDNQGLLIAADLLSAGVEVVAVVDESPTILGREFNAAPLRDCGVEIRTSSRVVAARGKGRVESATIASVDVSGAVIQGTEQCITVDTICLAGPRVPESDLASGVRCPLREVDIMGGPVPVHDRHMATPVPGVYVCGDLAGVENGAVALESGRLAGVSAAKELGHRGPHLESEMKLARARLGYLRRGRREAMRRRVKSTLASEYSRIKRERSHGRI